MSRRKASGIDAVSNALFRKHRGKQLSNKRVQPAIKMVTRPPSTWPGGKRPSGHVKNLHLTLGKRQKGGNQGFKRDLGSHGQRRDRKGRFA